LKIALEALEHAKFVLIPFSGLKTKKLHSHKRSKCVSVEEKGMFLKRLIEAQQGSNYSSLEDNESMAVGEHENFQMTETKKDKVD
jgi:hypothetical protein